MSLSFGDHLAFLRRRVVSVNELNVGTQEPVAVQDLDATKLFDLTNGSPGVLGDGYSQTAGIFPFFLVNLWRRIPWPPRGEAHGQKAVIGRTKPFAFHPFDIRQVSRLVRP